MQCLDEGKLTALLDRELPINEESLFKEHLTACKRCQAEYAGLAAQAGMVSDVLDNYSRCLDRLEIDSGKSWNDFKWLLAGKPIKTRSKKGVWNLMTRNRYLAAGVAAVVLIGVLSLAPATKGLASQFLSIFRVDRVQTVDLDKDTIRQLGRELEKQSPGSFDNFVTVNRGTPGEPQKTTPGEVRLKAGFGVVLPEKMGTFDLDEVMFQPESRVGIKLHVEEINSFLAALGSQEFLPDELGQEEIAVTIPQSVVATYGTGLTMVQAPSPEVVVPNGVDLERIRNAVLAIPALPDDLRSALSAVEDWQRTVLVPNVDGMSKEVKVNGADGVFITSSGQDERELNSPQAALIWPREGVWLTLSGSFSLEEALKLTGVLK